jgi:urease accessory protein
MKRIVAAMASLLALVLATPAWAHHLMGGQVPQAFDAAFLSGLAHPVINVEHFVFIVAVGVLTAVSQGNRLQPIWFIAGTIAGCLFSIQVTQLPFTQWLVPASVIVIGLALALGQQRLGFLTVVLFAVAGFLHGSGYATEIVGSEMFLHAYLLGFAIVQSAISMAAMWVAYRLWCGDMLYTNARIVGGVVAGVGLTVLAQSSSAALFPVIG